MKKLLIISAAALFGASAAYATPFEDADANGDGVVTFEELQAVNPDATQEEFDAADLNGDGMLSRDEYDAAFGGDDDDDADDTGYDEWGG